MYYEYDLLFPLFRLDPTNAQFWRGHEQVRLRRKTFDVLRHLVEHPGQLITKDVLIETVWAGMAVSDSLPAICVRELRKALGDDARTPRFIETAHGRGYRFIAEVTAMAQLNPATVSSSLPTGHKPIVNEHDAERDWLRHQYANYPSRKGENRQAAGTAPTVLAEQLAKRAKCLKTNVKR